jgi:2-methylcitrate dehydratase PrpD
MLAIVQDHAITPSLVKRITIATSRRNKATLRFDSPQDANQARFSMQFSMASAVVARRCSLLELVDSFVQRPDVQDLMSLVEVMPEDEEDPRRPGEAPQDVVVLETVDGRRLTRSVSYVRGGPEMPLLPGELFSKFETCLKAGRLATDPKSLFDALMSIEELPDTATLYQMVAQPPSF